MSQTEIEHFSDNKLFRLIKTGNEHAFNVFFKRHWQALYRSIHAFTSDSQEAEDIVQDIFSTVWTRRSVIESEDIVAYLFKAAKFQSYKYIRDKKPTDSLVEKANCIVFSSSTEDHINYNQIIEQYQSSLKTMSEKSREVFELSRDENLSNKEIAVRLNISVKTVEYHMHNALKHLRSTMSEFYPLLILIHFL